MDKKLSIIGFGSQAKAWALNLKDSGLEVSIGLRPGSKSFDLAHQLGFKTFSLDESIPSSLAVVLAPDDAHEAILNQLKEEAKTLVFAHGFSLFYERLAEKFPHFNCLLLAPKAIASEVRLQYETKGKLGALYSLEKSQNKEESKKTIVALAKSLGITSLHESSVESETKADLFSEQTLLCSTLPYAALFSFNKLIEKGVNEETAYFECWHEVKLIADTMVKMGPARFFELISPNALAGSEAGRLALFGEDYLEKLEVLYSKIEDSSFANSLKDADFNKIKNQVVSFWSDQQLTKTHERISKELY